LGRQKGTIQPEVKKDFIELYEEFIKDAKVTKAESTLKQHRNTINHLKAFSAKRSVQVTLESIDMGFYERFTSDLYTEKAFGNNTVARCIKNIKTFLNYLTAKGLSQNLAYQKREFKKPSAPRDIIYLTGGSWKAYLRRIFPVTNASKGYGLCSCLSVRPGFGIQTWPI
jgi:site-specific recombinase XerD